MSLDPISLWSTAALLIGGKSNGSEGKDSLREAPASAISTESACVLLAGIVMVTLLAFSGKSALPDALAGRLIGHDTLILILVWSVGMLACGGAVLLTRQGKIREGIGLLILALLACVIISSNAAQKRLKTESPETISYTFILGNDVQGAELFLNDVSVGTTPLTLTWEEIRDKVAPLEDPDDLPERDSVTTYSQTLSPGITGLDSWFSLQLPSGTGTQVYIARAKLNGAWGLVTGSISSSSITEVSEWRYTYRIGVRFPERERRISALLGMALAQNFESGKLWGDVLESFGPDGMNALEKALEVEPRFGKCIDAWAQDRYGINSAISEAEAWQVLKKMAKEVDDAGSYDTSSMVGLALDRLAPLLPEEQLVNHAEQLLKQWRNADFGYSYNGTKHFSTSSRNDNAGSRKVPPSVYLVAHAIRRLHERQLARGEWATSVQTRIVPYLIRRDPNGQNLLKVAAHIGGPVVEKNLLRKPWDQPAESLPVQDQIFTKGNQLNRWLTLAVLLPGNTGDQFRQSNQAALVNMADVQNGTSYGGWSFAEEANYVFRSRDLCLAFWPVYKSRERSRPGPRLRPQLKYLIRMRDDATVEMILECWRSSKIDTYEITEALQLLDEFPLEKRNKVLTGMLYDADREAGYLENIVARYGSYAKFADYLRERRDVTPAEWKLAQDITKLQDLAANDPTWAASWLRAYPWSPVVPALVNHEKPRMRQLATFALTLWPTEANQARLARLAEDEDVAVRDAAAKGMAKLAELRALSAESLMD